MGLLLTLKEGGSLIIDTIGNLPIDEDLDLLPEVSAFNFNLRFLLWKPNNRLQVGISADELTLLGV